MTKRNIVFFFHNGGDVAGGQIQILDMIMQFMIHIGKKMEKQCEQSSQTFLNFQTLLQSAPYNDYRMQARKSSTTYKFGAHFESQPSTSVKTLQTDSSNDGRRSKNLGQQLFAIMNPIS